MTAWLGRDYSPADFNRDLAPKRDRDASDNGQASLFATGTPIKAPKPALARVVLPGEVALFGDDGQDAGDSPSARGHAPDPEHGAFDVCQHCRTPIVQHWERRETWVTMTGGNAECYGRK